MAQSLSGSPRPGNKWDFASVFTFLDAFDSTTNTAEVEPSNNTLILSSSDAISIPKALGDFSRLWEHIGKPIDTEPPTVPSTPTHSSTSDFSDASDSTSTTLASTPPSSTTDALDNTDEDAKPRSGDQWIDKVTPVKAPRRVKATTQADKRRDVINTLVGNNALPSSAPPKGLSRTISRVRSSPTKLLQSSDSEEDLLPRPVVASSKTVWISDDGPPPPSQNLLSTYTSPYVIRPVYTLTPSEQFAKLAGKLERNLGMPPMTYHQTIEPAKGGIHVFVDSSNIVISFYELLKLTRGLHPTTRVKNAPFNFPGLAMIMERGRSVARKILVGSNSSSLSSDGTTAKQPPYVDDAKSCGYEINMLERVLKPKLTTRGKKRINSGNGYAASGYSSESETRPYIPKVMAEQAVDEVLHMKLLESLVDTATPSTIVLATGDAAEAEYSGGFLKNVERALVKGWKVELVAWSENISQDYKSYGFRRKWGNDFTIIELDDYLEELLAIYAIQHGIS